MAFEEDLGFDPSQPREQDYKLSATGLVSRTFSLWTSKLVQYILIVGLVGAACVAVGFVLLFAVFGLVGVLGADPFSYVFNLFALTTFPDVTLIALSIGFAIFAFVLNAIIGGAAIKFALDDYGEQKGDVGSSFSHSLGRVSTVIIVQLLISFLAAALLTPGSILTLRALEGFDFSDPLNPIMPPPETIELMMSAIGLFLLGGIVLLFIQIRFAPTLAIVIDTDLSAIDSLKKSWRITSGNMLHIFGAQILFGLVVVVISVAVTFTLLFVPYGYVIESIVIALLFGALNYIFATVLYRDLTSRNGKYELPEYVL